MSGSTDSTRAAKHAFLLLHRRPGNENSPWITRKPHSQTTGAAGPGKAARPAYPPGGFSDPAGSVTPVEPPGGGL